MRPPSLLHPRSLGVMERLARLSPAGSLVEIGVYQGGSAAVLAEVARAQGRALHLFDTFAGIPAQGPLDSHKAGDFADTSADAVRAVIPDAVLHVGIFPATLPKRLSGVAFAHVDCDQHDGVAAAIDRLGPRMAPGGIMLFDDYGCLDGATRAVDERCSEIWRTPMGRAFVFFPQGS